MQRLINPYPLFLDNHGALLDGGQIFVGEPGQDPESSPKDVFWNATGTLPAVQPLRTLGGVIVNGETPSFVFFEEGDYSLRILDADDLPVFYASSVDDVTGSSEEGASYQPLDSDLTAIAALTTTAFGRAFLTFSNWTAVKAAAGITPGLPSTGGTMTGNITRSGAGVHPYFADAAMTGGRIYLTAAGAADPTSQPGDIWFTY